MKKGHRICKIAAEEACWERFKDEREEEKEGSAWNVTIIIDTIEGEPRSGCGFTGAELS
jgi:hypothetical protein